MGMMENKLETAVLSYRTQMTMIITKFGNFKPLAPQDPEFKTVRKS